MFKFQQFSKTKRNSIQVPGSTPKAPTASYLGSRKRTATTGNTSDTKIEGGVANSNEQLKVYPISSDDIPQGILIHYITLHVFF